MTNMILGAVAPSHLGLDLTPASGLVAATQVTIQFTNSGNVGLIVNNGAGASITVTPNIQRQIENLPYAATANQVSLPAGKMWLFGSWSPQNYNQTIAGLADQMTVTLSSITTVSVALIYIPTTSP